MSVRKLPALMIDDNGVVRKILSTALKNAGVETVFEAADGQAAKDLTESGAGPFSIVVCDWIMPVMDGMDFLKYFRSVDQETPFVMLTSMTDIKGHNKARSLGASHFFIKPLSNEDLEVRLNSILDLADKNSAG